MKQRGRPVLGAVSGLLFGLFVGLDLIMLKVVESDSVLLLVLPFLFLVIGIVLGVAAPLRGDRSAVPVVPTTPAEG